MNRKTIIPIFIFFCALFLAYLAFIDFVFWVFSLAIISVGLLFVFLYFEERLSKLRESERYYRILVENARDAIVIVQNGILKYANPFTEEVLGYKKGELKGKRFLDVIAEGSKKQMDSSAFYEAVFLTKKGNPFPVEIHATPITYEGKSAEILIIREIGTRKKLEEIFQYQKERFYALAENTPDIIARFDEEGRYVYINLAGEKEFGIAKKDFFWKTNKDLDIMNGRANVFNDAIRSVFEAKKRKSFYGEAVIGGTKKYYYTILVPEFSDEGGVTSVLAITRDITEIKEIDQAKSEFISITSHQLRSPLSIINWCSLSLLRGDAGEMSEEQEKYVEKIYGATKNLIKITDAFINTTMIDLGVFIFSPRKIDLVKVAKGIVGEFSGFAKSKRIEIEENYGSVSSIRIDPRVVKIIFRGLLSNAIEYTPSEGKVNISIDKNLPKKEIVFKIGDSGCGVAEKDKEKIFTKFYRAEEAKNIKAYGTGLDIYLIKAIMDKLGGSIEVESPNPEFGKGTLFCVRIPINGENVK